MRDSEIYMKVRDFVVANRLLDGTHRVITGFSGGADSVCLLFILKALQKEEDLPDFSLVAMHIHHGIRGDEADRDAAFAKDFCKKLDIDYIENHIDVPAAAKETGESEEMAGRRLRYEMFRKEACEGTRIATAHHKNDSAETVLMNIARGTGLSGLAGINVTSEFTSLPDGSLNASPVPAYFRDPDTTYVFPGVRFLYST